MTPRTLRTLGLTAALLAAGLSVGTTRAELPPPAEPEPAPSASPADSGLRLYREGVLPSGKPLVAELPGGVRLPGPAAACASCHRRSGFGGAEGTTVVPPVTGPALFADGRRRADLFRPLFQEELAPAAWARLRKLAERPAYSDATLARALRDGRDPTGRPLDPLMPRYALTLEDGQALVAFLRSLDDRAAAAATPGVEADRLRLGLLLPPGPHGEAFAAAFETALGAAAPEGVLGRRLVPVRAVAAGSPGAAAGAVRNLLTEGPGVLALVSALSGQAETAAIDTAREARAPILSARAAPMTGEATASPLAFALLPGAAEEGAALLQPPPLRRAAVIALDEALPGGRRLAEAIAGRVGRAAGDAEEPRILPLTDLPDALPGASAVLLLAAGPEALAPVAAALRGGRPEGAPVLLVPGSVPGGMPAPAVAAALGRPLLAGFGVPPPFASGGGAAAAARFAGNAAAAGTGLAGRLGHAAGEVVVEALRRAGRGVTRERLAVALDAPDPFEAGSLPALALVGGRGARGSRGMRQVWVFELDGEGRPRRGPEAVAVD